LNHPTRTNEKGPGGSKGNQNARKKEVHLERRQPDTKLASRVWAKRKKQKGEGKKLKGKGGDLNRRRRSESLKGNTEELES